MKAAVITLKSLIYRTGDHAAADQCNVGGADDNPASNAETGERIRASVRQRRQVLGRLRSSRFSSSRFSWPAAWRVTCSTTEVSMLTHLRCFLLDVYVQ